MLRNWVLDLFSWGAKQVFLRDYHLTKAVVTRTPGEEGTLREQPGGLGSPRAPLRGQRVETAPVERWVCFLAHVLVFKLKIGFTPFQELFPTNVAHSFHGGLFF